ncbi:MAG: phosphatidate cytidylyltransferase [Acidobacteria bacterium]|nr:phosphatidate cytidylyltransferase [Acidobacteriota bacterium]
MKRIFSALVLLPPVLAAVFFAPRWLFALMVGIFSTLCLWEFFRISDASGCRPLRAPGYALGLLLVGSFVWKDRPNLDVAVVLLALFYFLYAVMAIRDHREALRSASVTLVGNLYCSLFLAWLIPLRFQFLEEGGSLLLFLFLIVWGGDTGAYYTGRGLGRHLLAPHLSPKKTWEGTAGGLTASVGAAVLYNAWWLKEFSTFECVLLGCILGILGLLGDLWESQLKRGAGIKDSSRLIPGHGGILDRLDSLLFTIPAFYLYLLLRDSLPPPG